MKPFLCLLLLAISSTATAQELIKPELIIKPPKVSVKKTVARKSWPNQSMRGRWTWPGSPSTAALRRHLKQAPHYIDANQLNNQQLVRLHDSLHTTGDLRGARNSSVKRTAKTTVRVTYPQVKVQSRQPMRFNSTYCPTGSG